MSFEGSKDVLHISSLIKLSWPGLKLRPLDIIAEIANDPDQMVTKESDGDKRRW